MRLARRATPLPRSPCNPADSAHLSFSAGITAHTCLLTRKGAYCGSSCHAFGAQDALWKHFWSASTTAQAASTRDDGCSRCVAAKELKSGCSIALSVCICVYFFVERLGVEWVHLMALDFWFVPCVDQRWGALLCEQSISVISVRLGVSHARQRAIPRAEWPLSSAPHGVHMHLLFVNNLGLVVLDLN